MKRLATLLIAHALIGCSAATPPVATTVPAPAPAAPPPAQAPKAARVMKTGVVAFAERATPAARSAVVRGIDAAAIAADLEARGVTVRIDASGGECFDDAREDLAVLGVLGAPASGVCVGGPPRIIRGHREPEPKFEVFAFGGLDGEAFALGSHERESAFDGSSYVPLDRDLVPNGDGTWSAYGRLAATSNDRVALALVTHELRVTLAGATIPAKGAWARVTGKVTLDHVANRSAELTMNVTHVDGVVDAASYAALQTRADDASTRAARSLKTSSHVDSNAAAAALAPARTAFVKAFGADVDRARLFAAALAAFDTDVADGAYAYARASVAGIADPTWREKDRALRHELFVRADDALEVRALDADEVEGKRAARVLWKIINESQEAVHHPTLDLVQERFRGVKFDLAPPI